MSHPVKRSKQLYGYKDYLKLPPDNKYEIIGGILYAMTPSPTIQHQRILRKIFVHIANYLEGKKCEVFPAPLDVLLPEEGNEKIEDIKTVVQPDILVVCDTSILTDKYCLGSPDFIIEIVSPSSPSLDYVKKLHLYEKHKVKEYWIVNYVRKQVIAYRLTESGEYGEPEICTDGEINAGIFPDLTLRLHDIF